MEMIGNLNNLLTGLEPSQNEQKQVFCFNFS